MKRNYRMRETTFLYFRTCNVNQIRSDVSTATRDVEIQDLNDQWYNNQSTGINHAWIQLQGIKGET